MGKQVIAVIGASGHQGGAVVDALLKSGKFSVRPITRNPDSEKGKALKLKCGDVVKGDMDDVESLAKAFEGAYGAFFVTDFFEHFSVEQEIQQTKNLADAAKAAGLQHVVHSSLEDTRNMVKEGTMPKLHGKYNVPHFDGKGEAQDYVLKSVPATILLTSFYYETFINFGMLPKAGKDGILKLRFPLGSAPLPMVALADIGKCTAKLFEDKGYIGQTVGVVSSSLPMERIAQVFSKAIGKEVSYDDIEPSEFAKLGFPGSAEVANMLQFERDCTVEYCKARDINLSRKLVPDLQSFEDWVEENKELIISLV